MTATEPQGKSPVASVPDVMGRAGTEPRVVLGAGDAAGMGLWIRRVRDSQLGSGVYPCLSKEPSQLFRPRSSVGRAGAELCSRTVPQSLLSTLPFLGAGGRGCSQSLDTEIENFILWDQQDTAF